MLAPRAPLGEGCTKGESRWGEGSQLPNPEMGEGPSAAGVSQPWEGGSGTGEGGGAEQGVEELEGEAGSVACSGLCPRKRFGQGLNGAWPCNFISIKNIFISKLLIKYVLKIANKKHVVSSVACGKRWLAGGHADLAQRPSLPQGWRGRPPIGSLDGPTEDQRPLC